MIDISQNNIITINRGDTFSAPLFLNKGTDLKPLRHILEDKEEVYLSIMEPNKTFEEGIVKKYFTNDHLNNDGDIIIRLEHDDTRNLLPGKYFYQIKANFYNKELNLFEVNTVVQKTQFIIEE